MSSLIFHSVSFAYDGSSDALFSGIDVGVGAGWTGILGANGCGKTTLLRLACGELVPRRGRIDAPATRVCCPQRTDAPMPESATFLASNDREAFRVRGLLGIDGDWLRRWGTLSDGERKRMQIATSLWLAPDVLAADEPTNHLDAAAREMVLEALRTYRGIGLLVSHDRDLLDGLCAHSLVVSPPGVELRAGGYTAAMRVIREEEKAAREARRELRKECARLEHEVEARRVRAWKAEEEKSLRGVAPRDHDAREKARAARDHDRRSGHNLRQLEGRLRRTAERESALSPTPLRQLGIGLRSRPSDRSAVARVAAGSLEMGPTRRLHFPSLEIQPRDRIALTGPNGSGKSTLVRHIVAGLTLPPERVLYVPQELSRESSFGLLENVRGLPRKRLGAAMQWVSRLGSDPRRVLESRAPSPGEVRKLLLAVRMVDEPHLILLDEPTNHMDLPSVECLESALGETECALLLVSHDRRFLEALATLEWFIAPITAGGATCHVGRRVLSSTTVVSSGRPF
ncbi:MAG: ATP-binding cassette domain-containing protein [Candidatus Bipolaricaulis sp.]|nr:ATP-binding cassette domain-containing protein [Candidatus Bipolaricaulis sp.]